MNKKSQQAKDRSASRRLTTILIVDICDYSSLSQRYEAEAIDIADRLFDIFSSCTETNKGRVFNRIADGFLAEFPSARGGMDTALEFFRRVEQSDFNLPVRIRAGLHVGDVTDRHNGDILGHGVNVAARLQELADKDTILASSNIYNLLGTEFSLKFERRAGLKLKNISGSITAYQFSPYSLQPSFVKRLARVTRNSKLVLTTLMILVGLVGTLSVWQIQQKFNEERFNETVASTLQEMQITNNDVSSSHIRTVLENLGQANLPSQQASFALLQEGNVSLAIEKLERSLSDFTFGSEKYTEIMHQIAALSFHSDPQKAKAYYESLLQIDETDVVALLWLVRVANAFVQSDNALELYADIVESKELSEYEALRLEMDMAFALMVRGEFGLAVELLKPLENRLLELGNQRLLARWNVELGIALERLDRLEEAEAHLITATVKLKSLGTDGNLTRAKNVMGLVAEKRARIFPDRKTEYLNEALRHYQSQYDIGVMIKKQREVAEALHFMGRAKLELGDAEAARADFITSYRYARENGYTGAEFKSLLGMGQIEKYYGNDSKACKHVREAEKLFEKKMGPNLGPTSREILSSLECEFGPSNLLH